MLCCVLFLASSIHCILSKILNFQQFYICYVCLCPWMHIPKCADLSFFTVLSSGCHLSSIIIFSCFNFMVSMQLLFLHVFKHCHFALIFWSELLTRNCSILSIITQCHDQIIGEASDTKGFWHGLKIDEGFLGENVYLIIIILEVFPSRVNSVWHLLIFSHHTNTNQ